MPYNIERRDLMKTIAGVASAGLTPGKSSAGGDEEVQAYNVPNLWDFDSLDVRYDDVGSEHGDIVEDHEYPDTNDDIDLAVSVEASEFYDLVGLDKEDEDYWTASKYGVVEDEIANIEPFFGQLIEDTSELTRYANGVFDENINRVNFEIEGKHETALEVDLNEKEYKGIREGEIDTEKFVSDNITTSNMAEGKEDQFLFDTDSELTYVSNEQNEEHTFDMVKADPDHNGAYFELDGEETFVFAGDTIDHDILGRIELVDVNPSPRVAEEVRDHVRLKNSENEFGFTDFIE